jgi:hypothetical protein
LRIFSKLLYITNEYYILAITASCKSKKKVHLLRNDYQFITLFFYCFVISWVLEIGNFDHQNRSCFYSITIENLLAFRWGPLRSTSRSPILIFFQVYTPGFDQVFQKTIIFLNDQNWGCRLEKRSKLGVYL